MDTTIVILLVVVVVLVAGALAWMLMQRRRSEELRERFGPEYDRTVSQLGDQRQAEAELAARQKRVEGFKLQALAPADRGRFVEEWRATQARFVDEPAAAIQAADQLVAEAMRARLPDRRLRAARRRYLGRPPERGRELPRRARDRAGERARPGQHRGSAAGHGLLPRAVPGSA